MINFIFFLSTFTFLFIVDYDIFKVNIATFFVTCWLTFFLLKKKTTLVFKTDLAKSIFILASSFLLFILIYLFNGLTFEGFLKLVSVLGYLFIVFFFIEHDYFFEKYNKIILGILLITYLTYWIGFLIVPRNINDIEVNFLKITHRTTIAYLLVILNYMIFLLEHKKRISVFLGILTIYHLILNTSRGPLIILVLIIFLYYSQNSKKSFKKILFLSLFLLLITYFSTLFFPDYILTYFMDRIWGTFTEREGGSTIYRLSVIIDGLRMIYDNPLGIYGEQAFLNYFEKYSFLNLHYATIFTTDNTFILIGIHSGWIPLICLTIFFIYFFKLNNLHLRVVGIIIFVTFLLDDVYNGFFMFQYIMLMGLAIYKTKKEIE